MLNACVKILGTPHFLPSLSPAIPFSIKLPPMKIWILLFFAFIQMAQALTVDQRFFERPLSCPLRFSQLSQFREQVQMLVSALGPACAQNGQQALGQLNASVSNLENIASSWSNYSNPDPVTANTQFAKNLNHILGSLNVITSNNSCFYDIKTRGVLPVLADVIMSVSQLGLLVPSVQGMLIASGGYVAGTGLKIISELFKKKFNFNRPEERKAFLQLNCAFFDNRRIMEESGIFHPETQVLREKMVQDLKAERILLLRQQSAAEQSVKELEETLKVGIAFMPIAQQKGLSLTLGDMLDEINVGLAKRPNDYSEKTRQVAIVANSIDELVIGLRKLDLEPKINKKVQILLNHFESRMADFDQGGRAWTSNIDDYEMLYRGPIVAFIQSILESLKKELILAEAELFLQNPELARKISELRVQIREGQLSAWAVSLRLQSLMAKILVFERPKDSDIFSADDEGSSNTVDILDYHRKLQSSILGKEGKEFLKHSIKALDDMKSGLEKQLEKFDSAKTPTEKCAAAEKVRFAWAQYKFKVQESYDFVATNTDLYRSSFAIGRERWGWGNATYVLDQIESVLGREMGVKPQKDTVGYFMENVETRLPQVEDLLAKSACF
jgi:hypothetical protein